MTDDCSDLMREIWRNASSALVVERLSCSISSEIPLVCTFGNVFASAYKQFKMVVELASSGE